MSIRTIPMPEITKIGGGIEKAKKEKLYELMWEHFPHVINYWSQVDIYFDEYTNAMAGIYYKPDSYVLCSFNINGEPRLTKIRPYFEHAGWQAVEED
jgi:hypothetical protein